MEHPRANTWLENYRRIKEYISQNDSLPEDDLWLIKQREDYVLGKIKAKRKSLLDGLKYWDAPTRMVWNDRYDELKEFVDKNERLPIPADGVATYSWISNQKKKYKLGKLSPERIILLESIPGWYWSERSISWKDRYSELKTFISENVRFPNTDESPILYNWMLMQSEKYRKGKLSEEKIKSLKELKGWRWIQYDNFLISKWYENYRNLKEFVAKNGKMPSSSTDEAGLGYWVATQRRAFKEGTLEQNRIDMLEKIDGWYWSMHAQYTDWHVNYLKLKLFTEKHRRLPQLGDGENELRNWVITQRKKYQNLSTEKVTLLENLEYWNPPKKYGWSTKYDKLKKFLAEYGRYPFPNEGSLSDWVDEQRNAYKSVQLSRRQMEFLESLKDWRWVMISKRKEMDITYLLNPENSKKRKISD